MKIAIISNTSWNIFNFRLGLAKTLISENHEVVAIAPYDSYSQKLEEEGLEYYPIKMDNKGSNPLKDLYLTYKLYSTFKKIKPDLILQYTIKPNIFGTMAAKLAGIKVINNVSGLGTVFLHKNLTSKIAHLLYKVTFRFPHKVFFQNPDDLDLFLQKKLIKKEITGVLPGSGIDLKRFPYSPYSRNKKFTFLLISRLLYDKGIVEYVEAIKNIVNKNLPLNFKLMGSLDKDSSLGIPESLLNKWISEGLLEYIPFSDNVGSEIIKADCIVLPSYREGTPRTLLEAAALGRPLIATNVPGCKEVIENESNGYLCKVKNPIDLAEKMIKISGLDDETLEEMSRNSRVLVEKKFDEKLVIDLYLKEINILSKKNNNL